MEKSIKSEIFEIFQSGKIISSNSVKYKKAIVENLQDEKFILNFNKSLKDIGYEIRAEDGYFYLAKLYKLDESEIEKFVNRHKKAFLALYILRTLFSNFSDEITISKFQQELLNRDDKSIFEYLENLTEIKNDYKSMSEKLFRELVSANIVEKVDEDNQDRYRVLKSVNYYLNILDRLEIGE